MQHRSFSPTLGRAALLVAATIACAGFVDCAAFSGSHGGTFAGIVSSPVARAKHGTLDQILNASAGTYMDRLLADRDSTVERWADHVDQPIRVWVDSSTVISGPQAAYPTIVRDAFTEWASVGLPLRFEFVDSPRGADIRIHWTSHLDHKTGSTSWRTDRNGWLSNGDITLATHISDGQVLDARGMRAIALHEVGHVLGLAHSTSAHDIMAPLVQVDGLSIVDRKTIKLLYSLSAGSVGSVR